MSFFSNLMKKMNLDREDEYDDLDQDYDFEDEYEEEEEAAPKRSSFFSRREEEESAEPKIRLFGKSKEKVEPKSASMQVVMMKPSSLGDAINVSDYLLDGTSVLLNMEGLHTEIAQRLFPEQCMPLAEISRRFPLIFSSLAQRMWNYPVTLQEVYSPLTQSITAFI